MIHVAHAVESCYATHMNTIHTSGVRMYDTHIYLIRMEWKLFFGGRVSCTNLWAAVEEGGHPLLECDRLALVCVRLSENLYYFVRSHSLHTHTSPLYHSLSSTSVNFFAAVKIWLIAGTGIAKHAACVDGRTSSGCTSSRSIARNSAGLRCPSLSLSFSSKSSVFGCVVHVRMAI